MLGVIELSIPQRGAAKIGGPGYPFCAWIAVKYFIHSTRYLVNEY